MPEPARDHYGLRLYISGREEALKMEGQAQEVYERRKLRVDEFNRLWTQLGETMPKLRDALDRNHFAPNC